MTANNLLEIVQGHLHANGDGTGETVTTVRAKPGKEPGRRLVWGSAGLLAGLAGVAFYVSYEAQFAFVYAIKRRTPQAAAEAVIPDAGMLICAMLALAMAVRGRSAKVARVAVVGFAALSALMNYEAADSASAHSVIVYVMPAVAFAVCTDLVVGTFRRFYYGVEEGSPWLTLGRWAARAFRGAALLALYTLRLCLDREETWRGLRQRVLNATPLPEAPSLSPPQTDDHPGPERAGTKKAALLALYKRHPHYGKREKVAEVAEALYEQAGLAGSGTARTYLLAELDRMAAAS
jgi:Protein of unknown function (DUF2637)